MSLNENWMLKLKESNFFRYINFEYYKTLKRSLSRRLYEILSPKCYDGKEWSIRLTKLGAKLPIFTRTVETKSGQKEVIYASDVLVAIKPAINEINKMARSADVIEKAKALPGDAFAVEYRITGKRQDRVIHFKKHIVTQKQCKPPEPIAAPNNFPIAPVPSTPDNFNDNENMIEFLAPQPIERLTRQQEKKEDALRQEHLETLKSLTKKRTDKILEVIAAYYDQRGYDYVYWNIRYTNENAKRSYSTYLQKALKENWAEEWREEAHKKREVEREERQEKQKVAELEEQNSREKAKFEEMHSQLPMDIKRQIAEQAQEEERQKGENRIMSAKIRYMELIREYFKTQGIIFTREATGLLTFINKVTEGIL